MREIRTAIVFGLHGENVIFVLENDEVFAFGENEDELLGAVVEGQVNVPQRIENLCGQRIEGFECCGNKMFAISSSGSVFSWGENTYGQLGLGTAEPIKVPTKISGPLEHKRVVQVACGIDHTLALTSEGEVYAFGRNDTGQLGLGTTDDHWLPQKVCGLQDGRVVTSVACQALTSFALLQSGEIDSWGHNSVIGLEGVVISQIVCGPYFTLALSDDGMIYSWGDNDKGQLGNGTTEFVESPTIISTEMGRVREIAATYYENHPCAAINTNNQVYIWGNCNGKTVLEPMLTSISSFEEVFAVASPPVTYQRFQLKIDGSNRKSSVNERIRNAFDNPDTADFAFIFEKRKIHVHRNLLTIGSDVFKNKFLGDWADSCHKEHIVEDYSYDAFYAFLKYFYMDEVDFTPELALDVFALAHFYLVTDLIEKCKKILKLGLTVQNAAALFEKANLLGAKDLCEFCIEFFKEHLVDVLNNFGSADDKRTAFMEVFLLATYGKKN
ncbi:Hypothetical predicted protein [Cloeon dipterum]|uniref:BTB domain-containing protein n=1 Tax=Cloeon dipterum TaxID=197152 RepID=A0A8S1D8Q9_9INSE|nr:Hypothetical predicted protein [Cloeon dipterum]